MKAHRKTSALLLGLLLSGLLSGTAPAATTYKWTDASGNTVYSQQPPASGPYETMTTRGSSGSGYSRPASRPAPALPKTSPGQDEDDKLRAELARTEKLLQQNCAAARHNLELYTVYRRIKNDKGEIVRLDDDERARRLQEAKDGIREFCD
jgi:hypothetical protein